MNLLAYQFPDLEGFQPCQLAHQLDFGRHSRLFIQIINRSPNDGGSHWLTVSNINCLENTVKVYDSAYGDLPHKEEIIVASLVSTSNELWVIFPNVALQTNRYDCGLYAIANATALAHGIDPKTQIFIPRLMRESTCTNVLEEKHLGPFPVTISKSRRKPIKNEVEVTLYCLCPMPDTWTMYIYCDTCGNEYHPQCVGICHSITDTTEFTCPKCTDGR